MAGDNNNHPVYETMAETIRPVKIMDANDQLHIQQWLSEIVKRKEEEFPWHPGRLGTFGGLDEHVNQRLADEMPRCDLDECGLNVELRGAETGDAVACQLVFRCPLPRETSSDAAVAMNAHCLQFQNNEVTVFHRAVRQILHEVATAEGRIAEAQVVIDSNNRLINGIL